MHRLCGRLSCIIVSQLAVTRSTCSLEARTAGAEVRWGGGLQTTVHSAQQRVQLHTVY